MGKRGNTRKNTKEEVMEALEMQRGRYDEVLTLWNAKQAELEDKRRAKNWEYRRNKKLNPNKTREPNKTDFYDKF